MRRRRTASPADQSPSPSRTPCAAADSPPVCAQTVELPGRTGRRPAAGSRWRRRARSWRARRRRCCPPRRGCTESSPPPRPGRSGASASPAPRAFPRRNSPCSRRSRVPRALQWPRPLRAPCGSPCPPPTWAADRRGRSSPDIDPIFRSSCPCGPPLRPDTPDKSGSL